MLYVLVLRTPSRVGEMLEGLQSRGASISIMNVQSPVRNQRKLTRQRPGLVDKKLALPASSNELIMRDPHLRSYINERVLDKEGHQPIISSTALCRRELAVVACGSWSIFGCIPYISMKWCQFNTKPPSESSVRAWVAGLSTIHFGICNCDRYRPRLAILFFGSFRYCLSDPVVHVSLISSVPTDV